MKRILVSTFASLVLGSGLLFGQFFGVLTVFDPSVFAKAAAQLVQLEQQYQQLVQTYQMITNQYTQMLWMARQIPVNMIARYRAIRTPWTLFSAPNTYGTTGGWMSAVNSGAGVGAGYFAASERLLAYGAALANVPADQLDRLQKHYATIELTDGANQEGLQTLGTLRANAPLVESAIQGLENDSLSSDPNYNTEIGVLNKINAATVIALRNGQDSNKLLTALAEQQLIEAKRQRDAEVKAINTHIQFMGRGQAILNGQSSNWTGAILGYRL